MGKNSCVILFAKLPILGLAKTRIAKSVGKKRAFEIYKELLGVTSEILEGFDYYVFYAGGDSSSLIEPYFHNALDFIKQSNGDLGVKLKASFNLIYSKGYKNIVCVGSDSPYVTSFDISNSITFLEEGADVVLGPADDGGYYLVGCKENSLNIFDVDSWSSSDLMNDTLKIITACNLSAKLLESKSDIDTIEDYIKYKSF